MNIEDILNKFFNDKRPVLRNVLHFDIEFGAMTVSSNSQGTIFDLGISFKNYGMAEKQERAFELEIYQLDAKLYYEEWVRRILYDIIGVEKAVFESSNQYETDYAKKDNIKVFYKYPDLLIIMDENDKDRAVILWGPVKTEEAIEKKVDESGKESEEHGVKGEYREIIDLIGVLFYYRHGLFCIHAASVFKNGEGYMFLAESGVGKTTTALSMLKHGYKLLSDELVLVDTEGRLSGIKVPSMVTHDSPEGLDSLAESVINPSRNKRPLPFANELYGTAEERNIKCRKILILERDKQSKEPRHAVARIPKEEVLVKLMNDQAIDLNSFYRKKDRFVAFMSLLEDCETFKLKLGRDFESLKDVVESI